MAIKTKDEKLINKFDWILKRLQKLLYFNSKKYKVILIELIKYYSLRIIHYRL